MPRNCMYRSVIGISVSIYFRKDQPTLIDWADAFVVPKRFSADTMEAMQKCTKVGSPLSNKARDEIVNALSTLIMVHTIKPSPSDYNAVCLKLVKAYPVLKDRADGGFVSYMFMM